MVISLESTLSFKSTMRIKLKFTDGNECEIDKNVLTSCTYFNDLLTEFPDLTELNINCKFKYFKYIPGCLQCLSKKDYIEYQEVLNKVIEKIKSEANTLKRLIKDVIVPFDRFNLFVNCQSVLQKIYQILNYDYSIKEYIMNGEKSCIHLIPSAFILNDLSNIVSFKGVMPVFTINNVKFKNVRLEDHYLFGVTDTYINIYNLINFKLEDVIEMTTVGICVCCFVDNVFLLCDQISIQKWKQTSFKKWELIEPARLRNEYDNKIDKNTYYICGIGTLCVDSNQIYKYDVEKNEWKLLITMNFADKRIYYIYQNYIIMITINQVELFITNDNWHSITFVQRIATSKLHGHKFSSFNDYNYLSLFNKDLCIDYYFDCKRNTITKYQIDTTKNIENSFYTNSGQYKYQITDNTITIYANKNLIYPIKTIKKAKSISVRLNDLYITQFVDDTTTIYKFVDLVDEENTTESLMSFILSNANQTDRKLEFLSKKKQEMFNLCY
jgi:hypothetical protein